MAKRFTDTEKWLKNSWFIELPIEYKMFWLFILDSCDSIGIWECNFKVAEFAIGKNIDRKKAIELFGDRIKVIQEEHKWWIVYFCLYQYGILSEKRKNFLHSSYIRTLKENNLYDDYLKTTDSLFNGHPLVTDCSMGREQEKEKEQEKEQYKDKVFKVKDNKHLTKPTIQDITEYAKSIHFDLDAEHFFHHYEANGWKQGNGRPIVNWKSAVVTWKKQSGRFQTGKSNKLMPGATKYNKFNKGDKPNG